MQLDDESDVSTTARRDSDEVNDFSKDEQGEDEKDAQNLIKANERVLAPVERTAQENDFFLQISEAHT